MPPIPTAPLGLQAAVLAILALQQATALDVNNPTCADVSSVLCGGANPAANLCSVS